MDFGHTAPQFTVPIGCHARIDAEHQRLEVIEAAVDWAVTCGRIIGTLSSE
jgi:muramoyltetrapeptide carboxypeptidase LdcA involved in peptidoglycan recycling